MSLSLRELIYGSSKTSDANGIDNSNNERSNCDDAVTVNSDANVRRNSKNTDERTISGREPVGTGQEKSSLKRRRDADTSRMDDTTTKAACQSDPLSAAAATASEPMLTEPRDDVFYSSTAKRLDLLYTQTSTRTVTAVAAANPATTMTAMQHALQPLVGETTNQPKKKKVHYKKFYPKNTHLNVLASAQEIEERERKKQRHVDWGYIRHRWKKRKLDLRQEVDVGNAIQNGMRHVVQDLVQKEEEGRKKAGRNNESEPQSQEFYVDTSDEEQENILSQLMKGSQEAANKKKAEMSQIENDEPDLRPFEERMDFWELGRAQPNNRNEVLGYKHHVGSVVGSLLSSNARLKPPFQHSSPENQDSRDKGEDDSEPITLRQRLAGTFPSLLQESSCSFFPLDRNVYGALGYTHRRQLIRLAARHVAAAVGVEDDNENRLLQAIWQSDFYEARFQSTVRFSLAERGTNLNTFYTHLWRDRKNATRELAVSQELQLAGPSTFHGYTMEGNNQIWKRRRRSLVQSASTGRIEWSPDDGSKGGKHIHLAPATLYVSIPGTMPPIPCFPLDEVGIIFGPPDEFGDYVSYGAIDEQTIRTTAASLFRRYTEASGTQRDFYEKQLRSMFEKLTQVNTNTGVQFTAGFAKGMQASLPQLNVAWTGLLSMELNGILRNSRSQESAADDIDSVPDRSDIDYKYSTQVYEDEHEHESDNGRLGIQATAARLYRYHDTVEKNEGLERFGRLHFTFGLLQIARELPESAAKIFSRPLDRHSCRTPFDIFRLLLEHLEDNGHLVDERRGKESSGDVGVGELEFSFYRSIKMFAKCIECNPTDVTFHSWHLATLAASLLLCSGNRIGSGAHLYPSQLSNGLKQHIDDSFPKGEEEKLAMSHEVRCMLPKFYDLRRDTARALQLLVRVEDHQKGTRSQLSISSFLEWHEVVALLIGPKCSADTYSDVCLVHKHYATQWALNDNDARILFRENEAYSSDRASKVEASARELEQNPHDIHNWRTLAEALGPVGTKTNQCEHCTVINCKACRMLRPGFFINHQVEKTRETDTTWWGRDRKDWWDHVVLHLLPGHTTIPSYAKNLYKSLESEFSHLLPIDFILDESERQLEAEKVNEILTRIMEPPLATFQEAEYAGKEKLEERSTVVDHFLPRKDYEQDKTMHPDLTIKAMLPRFGFRAPGNESSKCTDGDMNDPALAELEIDCYRVLIASHLFSPSHEWVRWKVLDLAVKCWGDKAVKDSFKRNRDELRALKWLFQLNISAVGAVRIAVSEKCEQKKVRGKDRAVEDSNAAGGERKPGKRRKKDPNAPKRAMPPFLFFSREVRSKMKEEYPELSFGQLGKRVAERYRELSVEKMQQYEELAKADRERYGQEMAEFRKSSRNCASSTHDDARTAICTSAEKVDSGGETKHKDLWY